MLHTHKQPRNPFMYYSAFKAAVYFKNNPTRCIPLHSHETRNTLAQLQYRKIEQVILDRRNGYQWCIEQIEKMCSKVHIAMLYSAYDTHLCYAKFFNGKWHVYQEPMFTPENMTAVSNQYSVKNGYAILHDLEPNLLTYSKS
jgi:hypothetical protein